MSQTKTMPSAKQDEDTIKKFIEDTLKKNGQAPSREMLALVEEMILKIVKGGISPAEACGISSQFLEKVYEDGYRLFQNGKYKEATHLFEFLNTLEDFSARSTFALAASYHKMKRYPEAIKYYTMNQTTDEANPTPYYHLYDCFLNLKQPALAYGALTLAHGIAKKDRRYAQLTAKIEALLNGTTR